MPKQPDFPPQLKKTYWDKNKGVVAKLSGATGIGDALGDVEVAFNNLDWAALDIAENFRNDPNKPFTLAQLDAGKTKGEQAAAACDGLKKKVMKLHALAKVKSAEYRKSKMIPKKAGDLCDEIADAAEKLAEKVDPAATKRAVEKETQEARNATDLTFASFTARLGGKVTELQKGIAGLASKPSHKTWLDLHMMTRFRDVNQIIGNAAPLAEKGYPVGKDAAACRQYFKDANLFSRVDCPFADDADQETINDHVRTAGKLYFRAKEFV